MNLPQATLQWYHVSAANWVLSRHNSLLWSCGVEHFTVHCATHPDLGTGVFVVRFTYRFTYFFQNVVITPLRHFPCWLYETQANRLGKSDPKCFIIWNGDEAGSTSTRYSTLDPCWDPLKESFYLRLPRDRSLCELHVDVWDMDYAGTKRG